MLSIQQVTKKIEDKSLLDNVSFDVPKGSSIGLIGPNGAGKSTLMKLISLMKSLRVEALLFTVKTSSIGM